jgi:hypothetical protein
MVDYLAIARRALTERENLPFEASYSTREPLDPVVRRDFRAFDDWGFRLPVGPGAARQSQLRSLARDTAPRRLGSLSDCCLHCGSSKFIDVAIHAGQSIRRDCVVGDSLAFQFRTGRILSKMESSDIIPTMVKDPKRKRSNLVSDQLRQAIDDSGLTRYRIAQETGVSEAALALFYNGQRGLSMKALNALGECLQLRIHLGRKPETKGK